MKLQKIYLSGDAPDVYPDNRPEGWSQESLKHSPIVLDKGVAIKKHDDEKQKFIDKFLNEKLKDSDNNPLPEVFLRFHLRKDAILALLEQTACNGLSVSLAAKPYKFRTKEGESFNEETKDGTIIIVCGVDGSMKDLYESSTLADYAYLQLQVSPCPPKKPCGAQKAFLPDGPEYSQTSDLADD